MNSDLQFYESISNLKSIYKREMDGNLNTQQAIEITSRLKQGRTYFESAERSSLDIKPLILYYGMVAFAQAITLFRNWKAQNSLAKSHGLKDNTPNNALLAENFLSLNGRGTFQEFSDLMSSLGRVHYYDGTSLLWKRHPFDECAKLGGIALSLKEILSRIPSLMEIYSKTFGDLPNCVALEVYTDTNGFDGSIELRFWDKKIVRGRDELLALAKVYKERYSFLRQWRFLQASEYWDNTLVTFGNLDIADTEEFRNTNIGATAHGILSSMWGRPQVSKVDAFSILPPLCGGLELSHTSYVLPYKGIHLTHYAYTFMAIFLLGSLVRYRPRSWQHSLSSSILPTVTADDSMMSIINHLISHVLTSFPEAVVNVMEYGKEKPR